MSINEGRVRRPLRAGFALLALVTPMITGSGSAAATTGSSQEPGVSQIPGAGGFSPALVADRVSGAGSSAPSGAEAQATRAPRPVGLLVLPAKGAPPNPGARRVVSPNRTPAATAAALRGPRLRFWCRDNPERLNGMRLRPGTVVEFRRGCTWSNVRVIVRGNGTVGQPILLQSFGGNSTPAPVFAARKAGRYKDDAVISLEGANIHVRDLAVKNSASIAFGMNGTRNVVHNVEGANVVSGAWVRGQYSKVWNSYFHDLRMMPDTPGPNDDYGASGVVVQAHDATVEGLTCRNCIGKSPDYDQWGGDGSFTEVWMKGDRLRVRYGYADRTPRVLEAGGLGRQSARNMLVANVYAREISDAPFYFNPSGDYSGIDTRGFVQRENVILRKR